MLTEFVFILSFKKHHKSSTLFKLTSAFALFMERSEWASTASVGRLKPGRTCKVQPEFKSRLHRDLMEAEYSSN